MHNKDNNNNSYELYKKAIEFAKNKNTNHEGLSNLYVIQKIDLDGNVTGEYFGMNMMTDYGMTKYFIDGTTFPTNIYIGNGTGTFNHTSSSLISAVTTTASTVSDKNISYAFPLYYDEYSGLITCTCQYLVAYFDYNIDGITDTVAITEYGIGTAYNALWTHSWVYDTTGSQTYINKAVNERLTITVFLCFSYYESLITDGYAEDKYTIITTMEKFFNKMYESNIYTYKRGNKACKRNKNNTKTKFDNNEITLHTNLDTFIMYQGTDTDSGYIDGFCQWYSGCMTLEPQMLDEPEEFDTTLKADFDNTTSTGLADKFGLCETTMFTQADISNVYLYNNKTGAYDNPVAFYNPKERWYSETPMMTNFSIKIYYTNNNTIIPMYVSQNLRTDDDIISIDATLSTIYATDKYWDISSWIHISNLKEIPVEARNCRYWISASNEISMNPIRKSGSFKLLPTIGDTEKYEWNKVWYGCCPVCDSYEYGWFMLNNTVSVPEYEFSFDIGESSTTASMTYGKWLVTFNSSTNYLVTNMSDLSVTPTPTTTTPLFTTATNCMSNCYRTNSNTGIICLQSLSNDESNVIDLRDDGEIKQKIFNSKMSTAVWGSSKIAYISTEDTSKVLVYDMEVNGTTRSFEIPEEIVSSVKFMFGHRNNIWISDDSTCSYVMNISDGSITKCDAVITFSNIGLYNIEMTAVDDVIIIYNTSSSDVSTSYYIRHDNPTSPASMSPFKISMTYSYSPTHYMLRYINGTTLVLLISMGYKYQKNGAYNLIADFGRFLNDNEVDYVYKGADQTNVFVPYGEFFIKGHEQIPIEYFLTHRIVGKTNTITTQNYIKNISGKRWSTTITNIPEFTGLPPGEAQ